jgi:hypothetical protein
MGFLPSVAFVSVLWHPSARIKMIRERKKIFTALSPFSLFVNMSVGSPFVKGEGGPAAE